MNNTVTLTSTQWERVQWCLRDLAHEYGYAIGDLISALDEQLED